MMRRIRSTDRGARGAQSERSQGRAPLVEAADADVRDAQQPFFTSSESSRRKLLALDAPLHLTPDGDYRDTEFVVTPRFVPSAVGGVLYSPRGVSGWKIRNCVIRHPAPQWDTAWVGTRWQILAGMRVDKASDIKIDGLHVEGMPESGLSLGELDDARLRRVSVTRCLMGASFGYTGAVNRRVRIDRWRTWHTWGPGPGVIEGFGGVRSTVRPGGFTGGDGLAGYFDDSSLRRLEFTGELFVGLKLVRSKRVKVFEVVTTGLMVQGTQQRHANVDASQDGSEAISIRSLMLAKGLSPIATDENGVQVSWNVRGLDVANFALLADGCNGHAIQLWGDVDARFRSGVISGWNGLRGGAPAYALEFGENSTVNPDFESANQFPHQERILRRAIV